MQPPANLSGFSVDLQHIDCTGIAINCGAAGLTIEAAEEAEPTLRRALAHHGSGRDPGVVDLSVPAGSLNSAKRC